VAFPVKQVRTLEQQLRIIEEVEKNPSEKRIDVAKQLGLPPSTLNTIIAKKNIREHAYVSVNQQLAICGVLCVEINVW
jgi:DNA-binding IclR family transcriptional regulator